MNSLFIKVYFIFLLVNLLFTTSDAKVLLVPQQYSTIQSAIDVAWDDTIIVSPGRYVENINFKGKPVVVKGNGPVDSIIIDGSQPIDPNNASAVKFATSAENVVAILDGFTITGGTGTTAAPGKIGGGIYIENSKPIIRNCIISNNTASRGGGIACLYDSDHRILGNCLITNCVITNNTTVAGGFGGGVYTHYWGHVNINYCTITKNISSIGNNLTIGSTSTALSSLIENSILWPGNVIVEYAPAQFNYCDIQGGWSSGIGNIDADPRFCDAEISKFYLASNSPCIGSGQNGSTMGALASCGSEYNVFDYPLYIGTSWTYSYNYSYSHSGEYKKISGVHYWKVMDSSISISGDISFKIRSINKDTVSGSSYLDTIKVIDTTYFYIERGTGIIIVRPPSNIYPIVDSIKGYFSGHQNVEIMGRIYKEGVGLLSLYLYNETNTHYQEILKLLEMNGNTVFVNERDNSTIPANFSLKQNYPNPFNPTTTIEYSIPKQSHVTLKVFDILGREVATLVNEEKPVGYYKVDFNGGNLPSGIYFCRMEAGKYTETRKLLLLK